MVMRTVIDQKTELPCVMECTQVGPKEGAGWGMVSECVVVSGEKAPTVVGSTMAGAMLTLICIHPLMPDDARP
jgi:hypothetical protein